MKTRYFLSALLLGSVLGLSFTSCSDDDDDPAPGGGNIPSQSIKAVGFDTEKPVKKLTYYVPTTKEGDYFKNMESTFEWSGNHLLSYKINNYYPDENGTPQYDGAAQTTFDYRGDEIICKSKYTYMTNGQSEEYVQADIKMHLDADGYIKSTYLETEDSDDVSNDGMQKEIHYVTKISKNITRDALHRATRIITNYEYVYDTEDWKWIQEHEMEYAYPENESDTIHYAYDEAGNFSFPDMNIPIEYTGHKNLNGFFISTVHAFTLSTNDIATGPFDILNVVKTTNLPSRFEHEFYQYEFDQQGYVTKVYDLRGPNEDTKSVPYTVFEY